TGGLLYFGFTEDVLITLHWSGTWVIVGYGALHVLAHWKLGGKPQLLRIFRPAPIVPPPPPLDPIALLLLLAARPEPPPSPPPAAAQASDLAWTRDLAGRQPRPLRRPGEARQHHPAVAPPSKRPRGPVLQANPFVVAISIAIVGAFFLVSIDRKSVDTLH